MDMLVLWLCVSLVAGLCFCSEQIITCQSVNYRRNECPLVGVYDHIVKIQQLSSNSCILGRSFGLAGDYVWVDKGCRAKFKVIFTATTDAVGISTTVDETTSDVVTMFSSYVTTLEEFITTQPSDYNTTQQGGNCDCCKNTSINTVGNCVCRTVIFLAREEQLSILQDLRNKLRVNKTQLSSFIRRKVSATDPRLSSRAIGCAGIAILVLILGTIVTLDVLSLYRRITKSQR